VRISIEGRTTRIATALLTLLFATAACSKNEDQGAAFHPLDVGAAVPAYTAHTLNGDMMHIGGEEPPTVVNVWATWCTSCQEEMAALDSLRQEFAPRGVRVIAVSVDNGDDARVKRFADDNHLGMVVAHDPQSAINQSWQVMGVPTTFVVGRDGKLVWRHTGNITDVLGDARSAINKAIGAGS
jgi:peroxiredoxin